MSSSIDQVLGEAAKGISLKNFSWETLIRVVLLVVIGVAAIKIATRLISKALQRSSIPEPVQRYGMLAARVLMWLLLALCVLGSMGAEMTSIIALLSVAGLAVSMALQNTLANVAGGIVLLAVRPFQPGHYVSIDGTEGTVAAVGLSYTTLVTVDNKEVILPNSQVSSARITNYSSLGKRRMDLTFSASYDDATKDVIAALTDAVSRVPQIWKDPAPTVHLREYQSSSIVYETRSWVASGDYWDAYFALQEEVRDAFQRFGVSMTYDRLTIQVSKEE